MAFLNGSADGYTKGFEDGLAGRAKASVSSLSDLLSHLLRPSSYTESFMAGYNEGWRDGNRKRNGV